MSSHMNNNNDTNENHVFSEDQTFRNVFFDQPKRVTSNPHDDPAHIKRARLDSTISLQQAPAHPDAASVSASPVSPSTPAELSQATEDVATAAVNELEMSSLATFPREEESAADSVAHAQATMHHHHNVHHTHLHATLEPSVTGTVTPTVSSPKACATSPSGSTSTSTKRKRNSSKYQSPASSVAGSGPTPSSSSTTSHIAHRIRKFRSRSLPNIIYASKGFDFYTRVKPVVDPASIMGQGSSSSSAMTSASGLATTATTSVAPPPLPPVNIQSLREIDLTEILKNPQLRHDILFDPQLQFRPNLDGERGRRKKITYDKYWSGVRDEVMAYYVDHTSFNPHTSRLPNLFTTLKEILISLLPSKDKHNVMEVLDIELIMQQLTKNSVDFVELAKWLSGIFKSHCAPMRDSCVDDMITLFLEADAERSVVKLVEGLRLIFSILEAMKLDVANHQIRILRPVLVQTAVDFERDYFMQMISRCKLDITDSINWFKRFHQRAPNPTAFPLTSIVPAVLSLLSCSNMVSEFPSSLAFDHARLIVLRANVRQVVCLQLCLALYRQMVAQSSLNTQQERANLLSQESLDNLKKEILAIITDDNGNVKWTRNIGSIALQLSRRSALHESVPMDASVEFAVSWLIKQTQPSSNVYSLMEQRVFNMIHENVAKIESTDDSSRMTTVMPVAGSPSNPGTSVAVPVGTSATLANKEEDDMSSIASRIALLTKFHWSVFGSFYTASLN